MCLHELLSNSLEFCPSLYSHLRSTPPIDHTNHPTFIF